MELVKEVPEKGAGREAESALEMRDKDDVLARLQIRRDFRTRKSAFHALRDTSGPDKPVYLAAGHVRPLQGSPSGSLHLSLLDQVDGVVFRHLGGSVCERLENRSRQ